MTGQQDRSVALVLAAHGDQGMARDLGRANTTLLTHRNAISCAAYSEGLATGPVIFTAVSAGLLKGVPTIEDALAEVHRSAAEKILVFPFFMADGYFVRSILPARISAAGVTGICHILPPLGLDTGLVTLIAKQAMASAIAAGMKPSDTRLVLAGHGSKLDPASAQATSAAAQCLQSIGSFAEVTAAFLEEPPFLIDELSGPRLQTIIAGFFSGDGLHASEDVPDAIRTTGANAIYCGPIGGSAEIPALILSSALAALAMP